MTYRYAIYWAPAGHEALGRFGAQWLGRDAETGEMIPQPAVSGMSAQDLARLTAEPRRYGFRATLKPPFALARGETEDGLAQSVAALARGRESFLLAGMKLVCIDRFLALTPTEPSSALEALAADCVSELDRFRAPASEAELARRRGAGLSPRQEELLRRWGYPFVMDAFQFHMTLTSRLSAAEVQCLEPALRALTSRFSAAPVKVRAINLFREPEPGAPLVNLAHFDFGAP
jgi:putative phosphonate metabolism protein